MNFPKLFSCIFIDLKIFKQFPQNCFFQMYLGNPAFSMYLGNPAFLAKDKSSIFLQKGGGVHSSFKTTQTYARKTEINGSSRQAFFVSLVGRGEQLLKEKIGTQGI